MLASCSGDDSNSSDLASSNLVKKKVYIWNSETYIYTFFYNGNKIVNEVLRGTKTNYSYTGDLITKIEYLNGNGGVETSFEYTYANGKMATCLRRNSGDRYYDTETRYTYNSDNTVSYVDYLILKGTNAVIDEADTYGKYTYSGGNLVKNEYSYNGKEFLDIFEYDTKNNPFKNITGFALLLNKEEAVSVNNVVKKISSNNSFTSTYIYNNNGFPTEGKDFYNGTPDSITQYIY